MTDLFVSQDGPEIRVCKRDEENLKQLREFLDGYGRPVGAPEPWRREIYGLWGDLSRAVRIAERQLAQAEKMKEALAELVACKDLRDRMDRREIGSLETFDSLADEYTRRKPEAWRRAREVLSELSETMQITIEYAPRCLWHSDCDAGKIKNNGVMGIVKECQERKATLLRCRKCGKAGYVPHGTPFDTPIRVPVVDIEETNDGRTWDEVPA